MAPPNVKIKHLIRSTSGNTRFPKLDECAHFHYENVELGPIKVLLCDKQTNSNKLPTLSSSTANKENEIDSFYFLVLVISNGRKWVVRRSYKDFAFLDTQLHRCVYDRKYSLLRELPNVTQEDLCDEDAEKMVRSWLLEYLERFSQLAGSLITCGPVLNWLELDNRGNRLIVTDEVAINTPAVGAAYVVIHYTAQAADEISFDVGDMISVIDMPPPDESTWWRGKRGFEVGFFPSECVEVIGDKVPHGFKLSGASTKPVFRKHGKLIAFFRSFLLSRPSRRKLKQSGILKERVFGCDLGEHLLNTAREIPLVLKCCTEFIEEHGVVDGIYRLSGVSSNIQRLRNAFDEDCATNLGDPSIVQDIHSVASLLKMYFRELPNPLLTYQLYDKFVSAVQSNEEVRLLRIRDVVQQLPPPHYRTLQYLLSHLTRVASHGNQTGMTPKNIAIVWAPNLLRSREVENGGVGALHVVGVQAVLTEYLIRYTDLIFDEKLPLLPTSEQDEVIAVRTRPKSLAISTPTKLLTLEEARARALSAHLPLTQQKYIDVGGGPEKLPAQYHTVINLPTGKQGCTKFKKSPSGWKSFFSRGWYSGSARDKGRPSVRASRKASTGSLPYTSTHLQEQVTAPSDVQYHQKKLRTVKSAESLIHCVKEPTPISNKDNNSGDSRRSSPEASMDSSYSFDTGSSLSKSPSLQKHTRSSSHESYFDNNLDICESAVGEEEHSLFYYVNEQMQKLQNNSITIWNENNSSELKFDSSSVTNPMYLNNAQKQLGENCTLINDKDNTWDSDNIVCKQKPKFTEELAHAKGQRLSWMENTNNKKTSLPSNNQSEHFSSEFSLCDKFPENFGSPICDKENKDTNNSTSPTSEDSFFWLPRSDQSVFCKLSGSHADGYKLDPFSFYNSVINKRASCVSSSDTEIEFGTKTVVELYGNAETVLVEVHATQDSSSDDDENESSGPSHPICASKSKEKDILSLHFDTIKPVSNADQETVVDVLANENAFNSLPEQAVTITSTTLREIASGSRAAICTKQGNLVSAVKETENEDVDSCQTVTSNENYDIPGFNDSYKPCASKNDLAQQFEQLQKKKKNSAEIEPTSLQTSKCSQVSKNVALSKDSDCLENVVFEQTPRCELPNYSKRPVNLQLHSDNTKISQEENVFFLHKLDCNIQPYDMKTPPSPIYPPKTLKLQDIVSSQTKMENITLPKKRQILNIPSPSSPVEEVRKKFELKAASSQKQNENSRLDSKTQSLTKEVVSKLSVKQREVFEIQDSFASLSTKNMDDVKRNSDSVLSAKSETMQIKRHSEPPVCSSETSALNKTKICLSKNDSQSSELLKNIGTEQSFDSNSKKTKSAQPSLFTQMKVRKLQSLQGAPSSIPSDMIDPWSDPILDMQDDYHPVVSYPEHFTIGELPAIVDDFDEFCNVSEDSFHSLVESKVMKQQTLKENSDKEFAWNLKMNCCSKSKETTDSKGSKYFFECLIDDQPVKSYSATQLPVDCIEENNEGKSLETKSCDVIEDEAIKRERINRIKEERRAQLREKLKTESFRLETEEKNKVLSKFRFRKDYSRNSQSTSGEKKVIDRPSDLDNMTSIAISEHCVKDHTWCSETEIDCKCRVTNQNVSECDSKALENYSEGLRVPNDCQTAENSPKQLFASKNSPALLKTTDMSMISPVHYDHHKRVSDATDLHPHGVRRLSSTPSDIRDRVAMFEHSKDAKELCRLGPNGKFPQKQSASPLTPSFVR